jgi:Fic family protein
VRITGSTIILPNPLKVPVLMKNLVESLAYPDQDILLFSGFKKYEFLAIHPFIDGNGRTSRLIWNYFLLKNGYPLAYIDIVDRPRYMNALQQMNTGDHDEYVLLILESIERSLDRFLISF